MPVILNKIADAHARSLIKQGKVDKDSDWSFSATDGNKLLGDTNDWAEYANWFLGEDTSEDEKTKQRFKYPFGKNGKVYKRALDAIRSRASGAGATSVYDAAGALLEEIEKGDKDGDRGLRRVPVGQVEHRFADFKSESYDSKARTVEAILSVGADVKRFYGIECLEISPSAVNLERLSTCGIPLIDSHNVFGIAGVFGRLMRAWFDSGQLMGLLAFDDSDVGRKAEGLVSRGTVRGISIGYRVDEWQIEDDEGNIIDPDRERLIWDEDYTFTAKRWELLEVSLVSVPADPGAFVRSVEQDSHERMRQGASRVTMKNGELSVTYEYPPGEKARNDLVAVRTRMAARARMAARQIIASR